MTTPHMAAEVFAALDRLAATATRLKSDREYLIRTLRFIAADPHTTSHIQAQIKAAINTVSEP
jgi:hypothetical protein